MNIGLIAMSGVRAHNAELTQLGLTLPQVPAPVANYLPYRIAGNLLFLAGQGPRGADGSSAVDRLDGTLFRGAREYRTEAQRPSG